MLFYNILCILQELNIKKYLLNIVPMDELGDEQVYCTVTTSNNFINPMKINLYMTQNNYSTLHQDFTNIFNKGKKIELDEVYSFGKGKYLIFSPVNYITSEKVKFTKRFDVCQNETPLYLFDTVLKELGYPTSNTLTENFKLLITTLKKMQGVL